MNRNSKWNWLVALTAIAIFSIFSTGNAQAWGPLAQSAIAQAAQGAEGMPPITATRTFAIETTMPKVFENTNQSYATLSYDFSDIMADNTHGMNGYCQALAWGASQTAEKTGDALFLHRISNSPYERWLNELLCDSLLYSIESPYYGTPITEVAVIPKLVSDATVEYTDVFGGSPISGANTILAAYFQAHVLLGEMAIIESPIFQNNAKIEINASNWVLAMDKSVENVVEYVVNSTQAQSSSSWLTDQSSNLGAQLLGKIGSLLVASGNAVVAPQTTLSVYSCRVDLTGEQVNELTTTYLYNVSRDLDEAPMMRRMAGTLYSLMTEQVVD